MSDCVLCRVFKETNINCSDCENLNIVEVDIISKALAEDRLCQTLSSNCIVNFNISNDADGQTIFVQRGKGRCTYFGIFLQTLYS